MNSHLAMLYLELSPISFSHGRTPLQWSYTYPYSHEQCLPCYPLTKCHWVAFLNSNSPIFSSFQCYTGWAGILIKMEILFLGSLGSLSPMTSWIMIHCSWCLWGPTVEFAKQVMGARWREQRKGPKAQLPFLHPAGLTCIKIISMCVLHMA
jgi:hypothetical protein